MNFWWQPTVKQFGTLMKQTQINSNKQGDFKAYLSIGVCNVVVHHNH